MSKLVFYTVLTDKPGYPVKWLDPDEQWTTKRFTGEFGDPGEASQEFQAHIKTKTEHTPCYLDETTFAKKRTALAKLAKQQQREQQLLATW